MSLRRRFVLVFAAYGAALISVLGFATWRIAQVALEEQLDQRLVDVAGAAVGAGLYDADVLILLPGDEEEELYTRTLARLQALRPFVDRAFIFATDTVRGQRMLVDSDRQAIGTPLYLLDSYTEDIERARREGQATTRLFDYQGVPYKYGFVPLGPDVPAMVGVLIPADFLAPVRRLQTTLMAGSVAAMTVAVLLGALLARGVVSPLEKLSSAAGRIQRGALDNPIEEVGGGQDEVARLARAMERMRASILQRDDRLRLMLAQVAHELRNPLGGLELFASAAATSEDPHERRRLIGRVRKEVATLNGIIDDFLAFARPLNLEYQPVDLRSAIAEAVDLAQAELGEASSLEVRLPDEPLVAPADADQIKRAVLNLLRNAIQSGTRVRLWAAKGDGEVVIAVTDDGPGISPDLKDRIFEPFVSDKQRGAGLGLAIVKKVAEAHGGRVEARQASEGAFGSGAEFRLYLSNSRAPSAFGAPAPVG